MSGIIDLKTKGKVQQQASRKYVIPICEISTFTEIQRYDKDLEFLLILKLQDCPLNELADIVEINTFRDAKQYGFPLTKVQRSLQLLHEAGYSLRQAEDITKYGEIFRSPDYKERDYTERVAQAKEVFNAAGYKK